MKVVISAVRLRVLAVMSRFQQHQECREQGKCEDKGNNGANGHHPAKIDHRADAAE